jgi:hypothetical protein
VPPSVPYAHFGSTRSVLRVDYIGYGRTGHNQISTSQLRIPHETASFKKLEALMTRGIDILEAIENKNDAIEELCDLGKYIRCCIRTTINVKLFNTELVKFYAEDEPAKMKERVDRMERVALDEIENTKDAKPFAPFLSSYLFQP